MENYNLTIEESVITAIGAPDQEDGLKLVIPKDVTGIDQEALLLLVPGEIEVEEGNQFFSVKDGCLIAGDGTLVLVAGNFTVPRDGSVRLIGQAFAAPYDMTGKGFDDFTVPDGSGIGYRAFAIQCEDEIHIKVPAGVSKLGLLSFMARSSSGPVRIDFEGDPEIPAVLFGTKDECTGSGIEFLQIMPDAVYTDPESFAVTCRAGSAIEKHCRKYGIPCSPFSVD